MRKNLLFAAALATIAASASAASLPPGAIDWNSSDVYTANAGEVELPPGSWCLVYSVRSGYREPRTLVYLRGVFDWCDPSDRVVVGEEPGPPGARTLKNVEDVKH